MFLVMLFENHSGCIGILFPIAVEVWMFCSGLWIDWSFPSIYLSVDSYRQYLLTWVATKKFAWSSLFARLVGETLFWLMLSQGEFLWWVISPLSSLVQMWHTHIQERIPSLQLLRYINLSPFAPSLPANRFYLVVIEISVYRILFILLYCPCIHWFSNVLVSCCPWLDCR